MVNGHAFAVVYDRIWSSKLISSVRAGWNARQIALRRHGIKAIALGEVLLPLLLGIGKKRDRVLFHNALCTRNPSPSPIPRYQDYYRDFPRKGLRATPGSADSCAFVRIRNYGFLANRQ